MLLNNMQMAEVMYRKAVIEHDGTAWWTHASMDYLLCPRFRTMLVHSSGIKLSFEVPRSKQPINTWWQRAKPANMAHINGPVVVWRSWGDLRYRDLASKALLRWVDEWRNFLQAVDKVNQWQK